jgi:hypothetical protein
MTAPRSAAQPEVPRIQFRPLNAGGDAAARCPYLQIACKEFFLRADSIKKILFPFDLENSTRLICAFSTEYV